MQLVVNRSIEGVNALKGPILIVFALLVICVFASSSLVLAQTTVVDVQTEGSGDIINEVESATNLNGAMVWNGSKWVVNPTWAHKYYTDVRTGIRLKNYTTLDATVSGLPQGETEIHENGYGKYYPPQNFGNYGITKQAYWYTKPVASEKGEGNYQYGAVEYRLTDSTTSLQVILRSRGVGEGVTKAYFDVYIDDETNDTSTKTTAFIGDPVWYTFPVSAADSLSITDLSAYRTGSLPGAVTKQSSNIGDYYLDIGGGADLGPAGVGKSFELHTQPLSSKFSDLSPSYITGFELKYMDISGNLQKIVVNPTLLGEKYVPLTSAAPTDLPSNTLSPSQTNTPSQSEPLPASILALIAAIVIIVISLIVFLVYMRIKRTAKSTPNS
jgi:hypothetical protein